VEKLLTVTDKSALGLGVSVGQFLGEAESNTEFEQVFGKGKIVAARGLEGGFAPIGCQALPLPLRHEQDRSENVGSMSLKSDIDTALLRLKSEGKLLHWRDYKYPNRRSLQDGIEIQLSIQDIDSGEEITDAELVNFFSEEQLEFISNFRNAVNRDEKNLEKMRGHCRICITFKPQLFR
jgi:hypothetical protein